MSRPARLLAGFLTNSAATTASSDRIAPTRKASWMPPVSAATGASPRR